VNSQKDKIKEKVKKKYKITNWKKYNDSLVDRGSIDLYFDDEMLEKWYWISQGQVGKPKKYSDVAIQLTLQFGKIFNQRLRQTEGFMRSVFKISKIDLDVPDYSTLSRRLSQLDIKLPKLPKKNIVIIVDSTGLKIYGEGEWKVRKHGYSKRRTWRKAHLAITPDGEVRSAKLTTNDVSDGEIIEDLLKQEESSIESFVADGAYDTRNVYDKCKEKNVSKVLIPPRSNARNWDNCDKFHPRNKNLKEVKKSSSKKWKESSGYHIRSLSETAMFRLKTIFGSSLKSRKFVNQENEFMISILTLNRMTSFGMPNSYVVE
jgi:hypothetical protein